MPDHETKLLTISEAAKQLGVHPTTLRTWADRGKIAVVKLPSGYRRFEQSAVDRMKQEMGIGGNAEPKEN
jgi:excisionase family DNA binding protein